MKTTMSNTNLSIIFLLALLSTLMMKCAAYISFKDNCYYGIVVSIHKEVPENQQLLDNIKALFTRGSKSLLDATGGFACFKGVSIFIPSSWNILDAQESDARTDVYETAHVRIGPPNPAYNDSPYTFQPGECGEQGEYMHFTPEFLTSFNSTKNTNFMNAAEECVARMLVHEWGHLRYGLFDEAGVPGHAIWPAFYYKNGKIHPTTCSDSVKGNVVQISPEIPCHLTDDGKLNPSRGCWFVPNAENYRNQVSTMYTYNLPLGSSFCASDHQMSSLTPHDAKAPTKHNVLCGYRSTSEVMCQHPDFQEKSSENVPQKTCFSEKMKTEYRPEFNIRRMSEKRSRHVHYLILIDVVQMKSDATYPQVVSIAVEFAQSIKPEDEKLEQRFTYVVYGGGDPIKTFKENDYLEVIKYINNRSISLRNDIPHNHCEYDDAMDEGLRRIVQEEGSIDGGVVLLISNGREKGCRDRIHTAHKLVRARVILFSLVMGREKWYTPGLHRAAALTHGKAFVVDFRGFSKKDVRETIGIIWKEVTKTQPFIPQVPNIVEVFRKHFYLNKTSPLIDVPVNIDSSLRSNTTFLLCCNKHTEASMVIRGPRETKHLTNFLRRDPKIDEANCDAVGQHIFPTIENRPWHVTVSTTDPESTSVLCQLTVTSELNNPKNEPIKITAKVTNLESFFLEKKKIKIMAQVRKGYEVIINATAYATIITPKGGNIVNLTLKDTGVGADKVKDDGVYYGYFTEFTGEGQYWVTVNVLNEGQAWIGTMDSREDMITSPKNCFLNDPNENYFSLLDIPPDSSFDAMQFPPPSPSQRESILPERHLRWRPAPIFQRSAKAGLFILEGWLPTHGIDIIRPNRVTDLRITRVEKFPTYYAVTLQWTSPGDDFDNGKAKSLVIKYSYRDGDPLKVFDKTIATRIRQEDVLENGSLIPLPPGIKQTIKLRIKKPKLGRKWNVSQAIAQGHDHRHQMQWEVYFALVAVDEANNTGVLSNLAMANLLTSDITKNERRSPSKKRTNPSKIYSSDRFIFHPFTIITLVFAGVVLIVLILVILRVGIFGRDGKPLPTRSRLTINHEDVPEDEQENIDNEMQLTPSLPWPSF